MTSQTTAPAIIHKLVETFEQNLDSYRSSKNETELRREFLDKFFTALGWDVANEKGYDELGKEVIHEFSVDVAGQQKKADYAFRVGRGEKFDFLVEAKKPSVKIESSTEAAFQIRRYGWSAKLPINILSDFEHFAVYDCRTKPSYNDKASMGRIMLIHYKDYVSRWNEIVEIFSPEAVRKGSFAKYAEGMKGKKGTADVDDAFLQEIERWRELLAKNIALRNDDIDIAGLNYSVQMTIDRIVFLRICEERGIEPENQLFEITNTDKVYEELCELFKRADTKYNSGLFHFKNEKEIVSRPDDLTLSLDIDDKILKDIISNLYYPKSPYAFLYIPSDILGQVYERFLGKVIRLTAGHSAKVEEKPEVRKAGGVYYTPTYIVEYIVKNTVGKLVENKSPKDVASLKIVDPSCGSGSFLLGAYQFLLDWHLNWYVENESEKAEKNKAIVKVGDGYRLTTAKKKEILLNNIYGVDIDAQAVEVTKLSLLLKVLENASGQLGLGLERVLPDLGNNIKCGNSLIGYDYFEGQLLPDEIERVQVNPFDWKRGFPEVFAKGGFDVVIGNPPWGASFSDNELAYLRKKHKRVISRTIDSYIYIIDQSFLVTKPDKPVGFIIPSTILNQADTKPVRSILLERGLSHLISLGKDIFGSKVLNTSTIFISAKNDKDSTLIEDLSQLPLLERQNSIGNSTSTDFTNWKQLVENDPHLTFFVGGASGTNILEKARKQNIAVQDILEGEIQRGVSPDVAPAHVISEDESLSLESEILRPSISGSQIKRYQPWKVDQSIIYTTRLTDIKKYPKVAKRLEAFKDRNTCREVEDKKHPWYSLHRPRNPEIFSSPKFIGLTTSKTIELIYDEKDSVFVTDAMYVFKIKLEFNPMVCMAVFSSKAFLFFYRIANQGESRVIPQVKAAKLYSLPYPKIELPKQKAQHDKIIFFVEQIQELHKRLAKAKTPQEKESLENQILNTDSSIDSLVYELYGLTEEEIKIVEGK